MEHKRITGGEHLLPFARSRIRALRATGMLYASQQFEIDGFSVRVRIEPGHEYIMLDGEQPSLYEFFTTGPVLNTQAFLDFSIYRGYGVNVKIDKEKKTLKGIAVGSTLEQSFADPPAWVYRSDASDMSKLMPHKNAFQVQGTVEHQYYPDLKPPQFVMSCFTCPIQINSLNWGGMIWGVTSFHDIGYDAAPSIFNKGKYPLGRNGLAPDTDWYKKSAARTVKHPTHGSRLLIIMTDASGNLHVYPTTERDDTLRVGSPYAEQQIKTNVPSGVTKSQKIPYPAWVKTSTGKARDYYPFSYAPNTYRWEFNSTATRMVCILAHDLEEIYFGEAEDNPSVTGGLIARPEMLTGLLEIAIDIELTGPNPGDFSVILSVSDEIAPTGETYAIAADYYWGDLPDAKAPGPIAKDSLLYMTADIYHYLPSDPSPSGSAPGFTAMRAQAKVINRKDGAVLREFAMHAADAPYGMDVQPAPVAGPYYMDDPDNYDPGVGGYIKIPLAPYADSFLRAYYDKARKAFDKLVTLFGGAHYYRQLLHTEYYALLSTSPPLNCATLADVDKIIHTHLDACRDAARSYVPTPPITWTTGDIKKYNEENERQKFYLTHMLGMPEDLITLKTWMIACDLRILAFATQTAAFKNIGNQTTRQDRIQVIVRNEVVETIDAPDPTFAALISAADAPWTPVENWSRIDAMSTGNPRDSIQAFRSVYDRQNRFYLGGDIYDNVGIGVYPFTRSDFNADYSTGAVDYKTYALSFMSMDPSDVFCVHPSGHWSIATKPIVYYSGASSHLYMFSEYAPPEADASAFVQQAIDIANVRVTVKDEAGNKTVEDYKAKHLDLFNQAYGKTLTPSDYNLGFSIRRDATPAGEGDIKLVQIVSPSNPPPKPTSLIQSIYSNVSSNVDTAGVTTNRAPSYFGVRDFSSAAPLTDIHYSSSSMTITRSINDLVQLVPRGACMFTGELEQR